MLGVFQERDKVIIDLGGRVRDTLLSCLEAANFEQALREKAKLAEAEPPELNRGEPWAAKVESYDGMVAVRFFPPFGTTATRVSLPSEAAVSLADIVKFKREQAAFRMRFVIERN